MKTITNLPKPVAEFLHAINAHKAPAFLSAFAHNAVVKDVGKELHGLPRIKEWADTDIFSANVTLELLGFVVQDSQCTVRVKVDGTFDRTGLPDPLIMDHAFTMAGGKITKLTCRLADEFSMLSAAALREVNL